MIQLFTTPKFLAKESIIVKITKGLDENGSPNVEKEIPVLARVENSNAVAYTSEGEKVNLSLKAFIFEGFEDFYVGMTGEANVYGVDHKIASSSRLANPDGSTNHYVLGLM